MSIEPQPEPLLRLGNVVHVHALLATAVSAHRSKNLDRSFALWLVGRNFGGAKNWFYLDELIAFFVAKTGKHQKTVDRWLKAGNGVFFQFGRLRGRETVSLVGKNTVFAAFGLDKPGCTVRIPLEKILPESVADLRAALHTGWKNGKEKSWASRKTIRTLTGVSERSQLNYDKRNQQRIQKVFAANLKVERHSENVARQLPHIYYGPFYAAGQSRKATDQQRYGLYCSNTAESKPMGHSQDRGVTVKAVDTSQKPKRLFFDNVASAKRAAHSRSKRGDYSSVFIPLGTAKGGNVIIVQAYSVPDYETIGSGQEKI